MSRTNRPGQYLVPLKQSDASEAAPAGRGFYTLTATTYFVEINMQSATLGSLHIQSNAALIGTATLESTDAEPNDAPTTYNTDDGTWVQQNPSSAYVPTDGTGYSVSALTITIAGGGSGGGCQINLTGLAPARLRLRLVITTGGTIRIAHTGKKA